jgi:exonuclease III
LAQKWNLISPASTSETPARKAQIHTITKCKILKNQAITGGDFKCVESTDLDVRYPAEGGRGMTYANASGKSLARLVADSGMIDAYRLVHGETKDGYSRLAHTVHTRIDRIYTQAYDSKWRWQSITASPTLFTGKANSDHLPVVAKTALAKERPPSEVEAKINSAIFDNPNIRYITSLIWKK